MEALCIILALFVIGGLFYASCVIHYKTGQSTDVIPSEVIGKKIDILSMVNPFSEMEYAYQSISDYKVLHFIEIKAYSELICVSEDIFKSLYIGEKVDLIIRTDHYIWNIPFMSPKIDDQKHYEIRRSSSGHY